MPEPRDEEHRPMRHRRGADDIKLFIGVPAAIIAFVSVIKLVLGLFGIDFIGPGRKFDDHVMSSNQVHKLFDSVVSIHDKQDAEDRELLLIGLIGECLENSCEKLVLQKALKFCFKNEIYRCRQWRDST